MNRFTAWLGIGAISMALLGICKGADDGRVQLTLKLRDGSVVLGSTTDDELPVATDALGTIKLRLSRIRTIKFGLGDKPDVITLHNDDKVQGTALFKRISMDAV